MSGDGGMLIERFALRAAVAAALLVALALVGHRGVAAAADDPRVSPGTLDEIDGYIEDRLDADRVPGAALAIVDRNGPLQLRGFGEARSGEAATEHTPFILCSVSKSFTALAVMQLAEDGKLRLDAPVQRYLPWFEVVPEDASTEVTVRRLLNQTSGIPADAGGDELRFLTDASILEAARTLTGTELTGEPGRSFEYANGNYVLLGAIIEAVSGSGYQEYVQANILDPLRMRETFTDIALAREAGLADGHRYWFGWTFPHTSYTEALLPAGAIISTATDMGRYMRMYLNDGELDGERVLSRDGIREMAAPAAEAEVGPWSKGGEVAYGMGLYSGSGVFADEPAVFHPGGSPDFGSMMILFPARGLGLTVLYNATPEIDLPGAAGALDRIPAGAASLLLGEDPDEGWSMKSFYLVFDIIVVLVLAALAVALACVARPGRRSPPGRLRIALAALVLLLGVLLLVALLLGEPGWSVLFLSVPDLALVAALVAVLLVAIGAVDIIRALALRRRSAADPA